MAFGIRSGVWHKNKASFILIGASLFPAAYYEHFAHGQHPMPVAKFHVLGFLGISWISGSFST